MSTIDPTLLDDSTYRLTDGGQFLYLGETIRLGNLDRSLALQDAPFLVLVSVMIF